MVSHWTDKDLVIKEIDRLRHDKEAEATPLSESFLKMSIEKFREKIAPKLEEFDKQVVEEDYRKLVDEEVRRLQKVTREKVAKLKAESKKVLEAV